MATSRVTCDLCGTEQEVESYEGYKCSNCGQEHCYDNDCYRIMLTEEQEEVLRQHRNGGIMITVDKEYLDGFKSALEAEEQEREKTGGTAYVIRVIDRKTKEVVQEETRKSEKAADRLWCLALKNVNQLKYKLQFEELKKDV